MSSQTKDNICIAIQKMGSELFYGIPKWQLLKLMFAYWTNYWKEQDIRKLEHCGGYIP